MKDRLLATKVTEQLARLRNSSWSRLPEELAAVEKLTASLNGGEFSRANLDELHQRLHKLAGSLDRVDAEVCLALAADVAALAKAPVADNPPEDIQQAASAGPASAGQSISVWLVEDDVLLGEELVRQLDSFNFVVRWFHRIDDAESAAKVAQPDILLMDVLFELERDSPRMVLALRPNLRKLSCPLLIISSSDDFQTRVRAAQLGAEGFILKPLDVPHLVNRMLQIFEQRHAPPQRVLIIDDDVELAAHYRFLLLGAGMEAEVLQQPEDIIDKISAFRPELILMDMHMPVFSGPDLAGVIRQFDMWANIPIVYLSAETDIDRQIEVMNHGADDYLTKPVSDAQLVAALHIRIERARQLERQISKDSLTGLLKHASIKDAVELEVIRAQRNGKPATVAMLDIDLFKAVNDTYGHAAGDVVISSVAMLLRQRLRKSDIIGRYGGEEFAVVLPECDVKIAYQLLNDLRQSFASVHFSHEGKDFACTISIGLACTEQYPDRLGAELLALADEAMYVAKRGGRNQVRVAPDDLAQQEKIL